MAAASDAAMQQPAASEGQPTIEASTLIKGLWGGAGGDEDDSLTDGSPRKERAMSPALESSSGNSRSSPPDSPNSMRRQARPGTGSTSGGGGGEASRPPNARNRSSGLFGRLVSRSSSSGGDGGPLALARSISSSKQSGDEPVSPKADIAALSKSKSKYKSHAKWDSTDITGAAEEEPFMDTQASSIDERQRQGSTPNGVSSSAAAAMAGTGSTAAARAQASESSFGAAMFPAQQRAAEEAAERRAAAQKAADEQAFAAMGLQPARNQQRRSPAPAASVPAAGARQMAYPVQQPPRPITERAVSEAAQRVLTEARNAAMGVSNGLPPSAAALSPPSTPAAGPSGKGNVSPSGQTSPALGSSLRQSITANDSQNALTPPKAADAEEEGDSSAAGSGKTSRRKSMLSMPSFSRRNKDGSKGGKSKSRGPSRSNTPPPDEAAEDKARAASASPGSEDPVTGRRRRFADTRELDLLATELAAQVLSDQQLSMGVSHVPPASQFMPGAGGSRVASRSSSANGSQISLGYAGANGGSAASSSNGHAVLGGGGLGPLSQIKQPGSSRAPSIAAFESSPSPHIQQQPNDTRSLDSMSMHSGGSLQGRSTRSMPGSPFSSSRSQLSSLPPDMLTGLGDGPYPSLGRRLPLDPMDAIGLENFGVPFAADTSGDQLSAGYGHGAAASQSHKSSFASTSAADTASTKQLKKAVLSMSMTDPANADQGLVKKQGGWTSPFGSRSNSRAPSRSPTPSHSHANLREKARSQSHGAASEAGGGTRAEAVAAALSGGDGDKAATAATDGAADSKEASRLADISNSSANRSTASVSTEASTKRRKGFFGTLRRKGPSTGAEGELATSKALAQVIAEAPPVPSAPSPVAGEQRADEREAQEKQAGDKAKKGSSGSALTNNIGSVMRKRSKSDFRPDADGGKSNNRISRLFGKKKAPVTAASTSGSSTATDPTSPPVPEAAKATAGQRESQLGSGAASPVTFQTAPSTEGLHSPRASPVLQINGRAPTPTMTPSASTS